MDEVLLVPSLLQLTLYKVAVDPIVLSGIFKKLDFFFFSNPTTMNIRKFDEFRWTRNN